ncbi:hypothetical protein AJ80_03330 [Polytolypa hystricis UAMH7299]|uniref:Hemerythrin-like domain-containing protein n=1 Tax=Polytolypa hystricis (strain UAMH7299) TaxID=1447883 RepID=A0A2B7YK82_POLH7|nr:hypothetical protein AJ80_03330 [Polytolypa hystricis UAMH7299]
MPRVSETIKHDHRELKEYYEKIVNAKDADMGTRWGNKFVWELARHSVAEELVVYPALINHIDHGQVIADKDRKEHQKVKELLYDFQKLDATDQDFYPKLEDIMTHLRQHMEEEEDEDLPSLESVLDNMESEEMSRKFERTKILVPTRSHPSAPTQPFFETVVGLLQAPIDRITDIMRKWPEEEDEE